METNANYQPMGRRHFEYFESLDELLLEQENLTAEIKESLDKGWVDTIEVSDEQFAYESYMRVFHPNE